MENLSRSLSTKKPKEKKTKTLKHYLKLSEFRLQWSIFAILVGIFTLFMIMASRVFFGFRIYYSFMIVVPFITILALALTPVIICKEIDLSFGSIMGFSGWVFVSLSASTGNPTLALIISLITGLLAGLGGIGNRVVGVKGTVLFKSLVGRIGGVVPAQALWAIGLAFLFWLVLNRHKFGTHIFFTGDNIESARMMGIPVNRVKILVFTQLGFFAAFAGILASLEVLSFWPSLGEGYLLRTIAAVFLGGTSVFGGMGTIFGTFIGCIIIGSLEGGIVAVGLKGFWIEVIYGLIIVISASIHSILRRRT
ncbi:MAG: ABC transporter permease [Clostridia bacterium]|nr:ABC transporter permease [Clostridia bacterium]